MSNPVGATTYRRVIRRDDSFVADEPIDCQRPTELEGTSPATSYRFELDLVCEQLPEHLAGLWNLAREHTFDIPDLPLKLGLDLVGVEVRELERSAQALALTAQSILTSLLGVQARRDLVTRNRAVSQGIQQPLDAALNSGQLAVQLGVPYWPRPRGRRDRWCALVKYDKYERDARAFGFPPSFFPSMTNFATATSASRYRGGVGRSGGGAAMRRADGVPAEPRRTLRTPSDI